MTFTPPEGSTIADEQLRSPAAEPSPFSILSQPRALPLSANVNMRRDGLPAAALRLDHQRCIQSVTFPNCVADDADPNDYPSPASDVGHRFYPVTWTVPVGCERGTIPWSYADWAIQDVEAATAFRLERFLWSDGSLESVQGERTTMPTLMTVASVVGNAAAPVNPRDGLAAVLADYLACNEAGGRATVHVPHILGEYLLDRGALVANGIKLKTATGHDVILGTGYDRTRSPFDNDDPSAADDEEDGTAWIVVSGPVFYDLGIPYITADPTGELRSKDPRRLLTGTIDPRTGKQVVIGARSAHYAFDTCCVRAIKVRVVNVPSEAG